MPQNEASDQGLHCLPLIYQVLDTKRLVLTLDKYTKFIMCPGPEVIKLFSCSTQLSMNFSLLINMKMPTIVGIIYLLAENFRAQLCLARKHLQLLVI